MKRFIACMGIGCLVTLVIVGAGIPRAEAGMVPRSSTSTLPESATVQPSQTLQTAPTRLRRPSGGESGSGRTKLSLHLCCDKDGDGHDDWYKGICVGSYESCAAELNCPYAKVDKCKYSETGTGHWDCRDNLHALYDPQGYQTGHLSRAFYLDRDRDGFGDVSSPTAEWGCEPPSDGNAYTEGWLNKDCDDTNPNVKPYMAERCDGLDNNCNISVDEDAEGNEGAACNVTVPLYYKDNDGDGFGRGTGADGTTPFGGGTGLSAHNTYYYLYDQGKVVQAVPPVDCNDINAAINPNALEQCDAVDNNCSGQINEGLDCDGDGSLVPADCDDANASRGDATVFNEVGGDDIDNDCNDLVDEDDPGLWQAAYDAGLDEDGDGFPTKVSNVVFDCKDDDVAFHADCERVPDSVRPAFPQKFGHCPPNCSGTQCNEHIEQDCADERDLNCDGVRYAYTEACALCAKGKEVASVWSTLFKDDHDTDSDPYTCDDPSGVCEVAYGPYSIRSEEQNFIRLRITKDDPWIVDNLTNLSPVQGPIYFEGYPNTVPDVHRIEHYAKITSSYDFSSLPTKEGYEAIPEEDLAQTLVDAQNEALHTTGCTFNGSGYDSNRCGGIGTNYEYISDRCGYLPGMNEPPNLDLINMCTHRLVLMERFCENPLGHRVRMAMINCKDVGINDENTNTVGICDVGRCRSEAVGSADIYDGCTNTQLGACMDKGSSVCPTQLGQ